MKIALVQMAPLFKKQVSREDKLRNILHAEELILNQTSVDCDLVVLPEFCFVGPPSTVTDWVTAAESGPGFGEIVDKMSALAARKNCYIVVPFLEMDSGKIYNSLLLLNRQGCFAGKYRKVHLFPAEMPLVTAGDQFPIWETEFGPIGPMICYDQSFPESARILAVKGARVIVAPTMAWDDPVMNMQIPQAISRAIENQVVMAVVNAVGIHPRTGDKLSGRSLVAYPNGEVRSAGEGEKVFEVKLDFEKIDQMKKNWPTLELRLPKLYGELL